jgi:transcriptional regulator of heat shock response
MRLVDYETRRKAVLFTTINRYVKNALPVSSEEIAKDFDLSSATIRNIFVELEESGLLTHPHISAGRIPTYKGYRYYVDFLSSQLELLEGEKNSIISYYESEVGRLEDALEKTSEVISILTHSASIVSFLDWRDRFFYRGISFILEQPEFQDSARIRLIIKMIEDKQRILDIINREFKEKVKIYIGEELGCTEMNNCSLAVSTYSIRNKPCGKLAVLGPMRMEYKQIIPTLEYISDVLSDVLERI